eukprot:Em0010g205a
MCEITAPTPDAEASPASLIGMPNSTDFISSGKLQGQTQLQLASNLAQFQLQISRQKAHYKPYKTWAHQCTSSKEQFLVGKTLSTSVQIDSRTINQITVSDEVGSNDPISVKVSDQTTSATSVRTDSTEAVAAKFGIYFGSKTGVLDPVALLGCRLSVCEKHEYVEGEEDWSQYVERLGHFFGANGVSDASKKRSVLLSTIGPKVYQTLASLVAPETLGGKTYDELIKLMAEHLSPKPPVIVQRYRFHSRVRQQGESVSVYVTQLKELARKCEFGDALNDMLRDRLVCGINDERVQKRLLVEVNLTFDSALKISQGCEVAERCAKEIHSGRSQELAEHQNQQVHAVTPGRPQWRTGPGTGTPRCYRCLRRDHAPDKCPHRSAECFGCGKRGHIRRACKQVQAKAGGMQPSRRGVQVLQEESEDLEEEGDSVYRWSIGHNGARHRSRCIYCFGINIPAPMVREGLREVRNSVVYIFWIDWKSLFVIQKGASLENVLTKYEMVFNEGLGTVLGYEAKLVMKENAVPRFCKARPMPYAIKEKIEKELNKLVQEGILQPVELSEWAAPIVPVVKPDQSIRICGDFRLTVNQALETERYPLPKIEDILASLAGGERFTKIPFGVSSAPSIFQRIMDSVLQGIPKESVVYLGYKIDKNGIHPLAEKVEAVKNAPEPKNITELKSYLGLLTYYSRFLPRMATMLAQLYRLLQAKIPWNWTQKEKMAFENSKNLLLSAKVSGRIQRWIMTLAVYKYKLVFKKTEEHDHYLYSYTEQINPVGWPTPNIHHCSKNGGSHQGTQDYTMMM